MPDPDPVVSWGRALASWEIPEAIRAAAAASPWALTPSRFVARAQASVAAPAGVSYEVATGALPDGGTVLDVGAGAGAAGLALAARAASLYGVDTDERLLATFAELGAAAGVPVRTLVGRWPQVAADVPPADVVVCHHVLYNVADLAPFIAALTGHARRRVVVEITDRHPASMWNPLWRRLHGLDRPERPTAADAVAALTALGVEPRWRSWDRPSTDDGGTFDDLVAAGCRRLCLPPERAADVAAALVEAGVDPAAPRFGGDLRELVTIWWTGTST
jgi:SAM-dependent methyltransferase